MAVLIRGGRKRLAWLAASACLLGAGCALPQTVLAANETLEYAVKANFLYKFGPFVEWPAGAFPGAGAPFNVCVFGQDPFGRALDQAAAGQTVNGRPVAVLRPQTPTAAAGCHVLYVGRTQKPADVLQAVRGAPVLTVTDESQGVAGGMIHFVLANGRVRFGIDTAQARGSGLVISSKLLGLAVGVRRPGGGG